MVEFPLTDLAPALTNMRDQFLIADPHEVIFFSSDARFRFRTLSPLNEETRARLNTERVYGSLPLDELPIRERRDFAHGQLITLPRSSELGAELDPGSTGADYYLLTRTLDDPRWIITLLAPADWIEQRRILSAIVGVLVGISCLLVALYLRDRHRYLQQLYKTLSTIRWLVFMRGSIGMTR